jgi:hypothetical protein
MLPPPESRATGIGALPHTDPDAACRSVLHAYPEFPYIPTLPNRTVTESIVFNDSEQLPGKVIREGRLIVDRSADIAAGMEQIYLDFIEKNSAPYAISPAYGSGFHAMMRHRLDGAFGLKSQITGPVTFGMQVVDDDRRPIAYDPAFADVIPKMLGLRARWCEKEMQTRTGVRETLIVLNEPYFASLGSSVIPIDAETVRAGWEDIAGLLEGALGIHCCSNTDWGFLMSLDPAVLSFDAYANAAEFLLYRDALAGYMERGGVIAWGIVPADGRIFVGESIGTLVDRYRDIRDKVTEYVSPRLFDSRSLITPSCGIHFSDENGADAIMQAAAAISCRVREGS